MSAFSITVSNGKPKLVAGQRLDAASDFDAIAAGLIGHGGRLLKARKIAFVAARQADHTEPVATHLNGLETQNLASAGDWIVTNMTADRDILRDRANAANTYVVRADAFARLYVRDQGSTAFGEIYKAVGAVDALEVAGGFDIVAPWGERQVGEAGYLVRNGTDVYGIHKDAFTATYEVVGSS